MPVSIPPIGKVGKSIDASEITRLRKRFAVVNGITQKGVGTVGIKNNFGIVSEFPLIRGYVNSNANYPPLTLSFTNTGQIFAVGTVITPMQPTSTGGVITSYTVFSGSLPVGLSLNASNGTISGTPTTAASYSFIIRGTNTGGSVNTSTINITVYSSSLAGVIPTATGTSSTTVTLSFQTPYGTILSYTVSVNSGASTLTGLSYNDNGNGTTTVALTGFTSNTNYVFSVAAVTAAGTQTASNNSASILLLPSLAGVTPVYADTTPTSIKIAFTKAVGNGTITVYTIDTYLASNSSLKSSITFNSSTWEDAGATIRTDITGLSLATAYYFTATPGNATGTGVVSNQSAAFTTGIIPP